MLDGDVDVLGNWGACRILRMSSSGDCQTFALSSMLLSWAIVSWLYNKQINLSNSSVKNDLFMIKMLTILIEEGEIIVINLIMFFF